MEFKFDFSKSPIKIDDETVLLPVIAEDGTELEIEMSLADAIIATDKDSIVITPNCHKGKTH